MNNSEPVKPVKLSFSRKDYLKAFLAWAFSFRQNILIAPGLYYTGKDYDPQAQLLVTCNYHLTVFILWRILRKQNIRLLVIDTKGVNVWCSSGKGQFSAAEIIKQVRRYTPLFLPEAEPLSLVLPKLCLSGVSLAELKRNRIKPIIGPVYAKELPGYLADLPLKNRNQDKYRFSLSDRLFTLLPSLVQMVFYAACVFVALFVFNLFFKTGIDWQVFPAVVFISTFYIVFFPLLPTKTFAVKGLALFALEAVLLSLFYFGADSMDLLSFLFSLSALAGTTLFFSLYYTGNSGVSNYSLVKKEIVAFLPVTALCFLGAIILLIVKGVIL